MVTKGFNKVPPGLQLLMIKNIINQNKRNAIEIAKKKFSRLKQATQEAKQHTLESLVSPKLVQGYQPPNIQGN